MTDILLIIGWFALLAGYGAYFWHRATPAPFDTAQDRTEPARVTCEPQGEWYEVELAAKPMPEPKTPGEKFLAWDIDKEI